jgi:hypothetical protein
LPLSEIRIFVDVTGAAALSQVAIGVFVMPHSS